MQQDNRDIRYLAEHLLHTGVGGLGERERHALMRISKRLQATRTKASLPDDGVTLGERLADRVAEFGGSWTFIGLFTAVLLGWTFLNTAILHDKSFDPYPYVFLNLILSMLAAIQAPIIMMSQNRQAARDRMTMIRDFEVNLKSEASIDGLHKRIDHLTWQILSDLDQLKRLQRTIPPHPDDAQPSDARKNPDSNA